MVKDGIYIYQITQFAWTTSIIYQKKVYTMVVVEALHGSHVFCLSSHVIRNLNWKYTLLKFHIIQIY